MKSSTRLVLGAILACTTWAMTAMAATEPQKLDAINRGLANLASSQQADGSWYVGGFGGIAYAQADTGAAVLAFMSQQDKWGDNVANYQAVVDKAVQYLLNVATVINVSTRNDGVNICPGGSGTCTAVYWYGNGESTYTTGLIVPAIVAYARGFNFPTTSVPTTSGPLANLSWGQIIQGVTNTWAASQSTANQGSRRGGWRYALGVPGYDSDMSTTQWGIISLIYAESFGASTPAIVKTDLAQWLTVAQDPASGAGCYQGPSSGICDHSDTGGLLLGLKYLGKPNSDPAVQKALGVLNTNWQQNPSGTWFGNFGHPYAMWSVYKGLEVNIGLKDTSIITNLRPVNCGAPNLPANPCNWWEDYNDWLVTYQNGDGSWTGYGYWTGPLATAFYINILGATPIPINPPPVANAGGNLTITSKQQCGTVIQGTASDPNHDPLQYRWLEGETVLLDWSTVGANGAAYLDLCTVQLAVGQHTLTLEVRDSQTTVSNGMILTIGNSAPNVAPSGGGVYQIGTPITVGGQVSDFDGDLLTYTWSEGTTSYCSGQVKSVAGGTAVSLPACNLLPALAIGTHTVTLTVSDGINQPISSGITIDVKDTTAPTLRPEPNKTILWPPDHKMVNIIIKANATDESGTVNLSAAVTSNEPQNGLGDGDTAPDWTEPVIDQTTGIITLQLRAERWGAGNGREYTIAITATDNSGNSSTANVVIIVPHDQAKK